jgi:predicted acetyltransferase
MNEVKLVRPSIKYKESFFKAKEEFIALNSFSMTDSYYKDITESNFSDFVKEKCNNLKNPGIGLVPECYFFIIKNNKYIGRISLRLNLNKLLSEVGGHIGYEIRPSYRNQGNAKQALRLCLKKADELHMPEILITCSTSNIASFKVITSILEDYGGSRIEDKDYKEDTYARFWLNTSKPIQSK